MSTGYGSFKDRLNGREYYADASGSHQKLNICWDNDTNIALSVDHDNAKAMLTALALAFEHNGWVFADPLGSESMRNSMLIGALQAALTRAVGWEEMARAALHNAGLYKA